MALTWTTARVGDWSYFGNWQYGSYRVRRGGGVLQESLYQGKCWVDRDPEALPRAVRDMAGHAASNTAPRLTAAQRAFMGL